MAWRAGYGPRAWTNRPVGRRAPPSRAAAAEGPASAWPLTFNLGGLEAFQELVDVAEGDECVLGRGGYGVVRRGVVRTPWCVRDGDEGLCLDPGDAVAVKAIAKSVFLTPRARGRVETELRALRVLSDAGVAVVKLFGAFEDRDNVYIVQELLEGGELWAQLQQEGVFSEQRAAGVVRAVLGVVAAAHERGVVLRDVHPKNFLFADRDAGADLVAIDFGLCAFVRPGRRLTEVVGTSHYMAPEVVQQVLRQWMTGAAVDTVMPAGSVSVDLDAAIEGYGAKVDVWSVGVLLCQLLSGRLPFRDDDNAAAGEAERPQVVFQKALLFDVDALLEEEPWPGLSEGARDVLRGLLDPNPDERLTARDALRHPWVSGAAPDAESCLLDGAFAGAT